MKYSFKDLIYVFSFLLIITLISCSEKSNYRENGLRGSVKSIIQKNYDADVKFGNWEVNDLDSAFKSVTKEFYTINGDLIQSEYYGSSHKLILKEIRKINPNKSIDEWITYDGADNQLYKNRLILKSDSLRKKVRIENDGVKGMEIYEYFKNGLKIKSLAKNGIAKTTSVDLWSYDEKGYENLTESYLNGSLLIVLKYENLAFDSESNWIKRLVYLNDEKNPSSIQIREIEYY